jgi:hypothetical protein
LDAFLDNVAALESERRPGLVRIRLILVPVLHTQFPGGAAVFAPAAVPFAKRMRNDDARAARRAKLPRRLEGGASFRRSF